MAPVRCGGKLVSKHPPFSQNWGPSEQPDQLRINKRHLRFVSLQEYLISALTALAAVPLLSSRLLVSPKKSPIRPAPADFFGVAISNSAQHGDHIVDLIAELGTRRLLMRVPVWERSIFDRHRAFADRFPACDLVISVVQDRSSVCDGRQWRADLRHIFTTFAGRATYFQLPMAPNRSKWGCAHMGEALDLMDAAEEVRRDFPGVRLVGPGIIDFEPMTFLRGLVNMRRFRLDAIGAMLYVDRRGSPRNTQLGVFDLAGKLKLWKAIAAISGRCRQRSETPLWITEFNWPLLGTESWSPTSVEVQVSEEDAAKYLLEYCRIAYQTGLVERLYWWQLVHPGFGLVDSREATLRRRPAFHIARQLISGELALDSPT
jgi:hypothetical protein